MIQRPSAFSGSENILLTTWRKYPRRAIWVAGGALRRVDVRKPVHAAIVGVMVAGIVVPVLQHLATEARYRLHDDQSFVMAQVSPRLTSKLEYDKENKATYFNREAAQMLEKTENMATAGSPKNKSAYSAKLPEDPRQGIKVSDTTNKVSVTMHPQFGALDGRLVDGRVLYPLKDSPGVWSLTPKSNGVKEDILLESSPGDRAQYDYELEVPDSLEAKLLDSGAVAFYSGDPALFGNISFSTDADRERVETARKNAEKTYLMFEIPAPVVKQSAGGSNRVKSRFALKGKTLSVITTGLDKASYPLSIDPTFIISTSSEFGLGAVEDNIDTSTADQVGRASISGGSLGAWATTTTLPAAGFAFSMTAYNGYLYAAGGGNGASAVTYYASINTNGTLGTWAATTTTFATGRTASAMVGWNGYIYVIGGENSNGNTQYAVVEYAAVSSTGNITAAWQTGTAMSVSRAYFAAVVYRGIIYAIGGQTSKGDVGLRNTVERSTIRANGSNSTWTISTGSTDGSFTTARDRHTAAVYNGYIYIAGGWTGAVAGDVQYVPINSDGSLSTWVATTSMTTARRGLGMAIDRGYAYIYGGCTTGTACAGFLATSEYAAVHADGTIGPWTSSTSFATARTMMGTAAVNGYVYSVGGCTGESGASGNCGSALADSQYAQMSTPGNVTAPVSTAANLTAARAGVAMTAYNGYLYVAGGCNGTSCGTRVTTVDFAIINDDGSVGTWAATTNGLPAARYGGTLVGYGGKIYYLGGDDGTGNGTTVVYSAAPSTTTGNIGSAWTTEANTFATGRYWHAASVYADYVYIMGGTGSGGPFNTIEYTQMVGNVPSAPANCVANGGTLGGTNSKWCAVGSGSRFTTARYGLAGVAYGGNLYVGAGQTATPTLLDDFQKSVIGANGYPGAFTSSGQASLPANGTDTTIGHSFVGAVAHNNVLYLFGGIRNANNAATTIMYAPLTGTAGDVSAWNKSTQALTTARWGIGAATYNGLLYIGAGCSSNAQPPCTTYLGNAASGAQQMRVDNGGRGMNGMVAANTNPWTSQVTPAVTARADHGVIAYNGYIYAVGGCNSYTSGVCTASGNYLTSIYFAPLNSDGSVGTWTTTGATALPEGRMNMGVVIYNNFIYVMGGTTSASSQTAKVMHATVNSTGTIGAWTDDTSNYLPGSRRSFGASASLSGYLYVVGGHDGTNHKNDIYYTRLAADGTLFAPSGCTATNGWCTSGNTLPSGRRELTAVIYNQVLYAVGGYDGTNALGDTVFAPLSTTDGSVGTFSSTTYSDKLSRSRTAAAANGYMYFFGSETSSTDAFYSAINYNGSLGNLYRPSQGGMAASTNHAHSMAGFYNGYFYAVGGCTVSAGACANGAPNATVEYVGQKANARVGHYSKLYDTQVDTAPSLFVVNGSGSFVALIRTASTSDPVLGVAQNISPALSGNFNLIFALNSAGTNVGVAFNYLVLLSLDDSNAGTFPDTTTSYVTDFTIFYHANPNRRLRHGASFTDSACNEFPTEGCLLDTAP